MGCGGLLSKEVTSDEVELVSDTCRFVERAWVMKMKTKTQQPPWPTDRVVVIVNILFQAGISHHHLKN